MRQTNRLLLVAGLAVPILYFGNLLVSSLLYPGYSHVTQYASELGSSSARYPAVFNTGVVMIGIAGLAAALGLYTELRGRGTGKALAGIVAALVALWGVSMVMGGMFPMPDPRHGGYGLGLGIYLVPPLLVFALRRDPDLARLRWFLVGSWVFMVVMFAIMMGVGQLVTRANVGAFQRVNALASFPWFAVVAWVLARRERSRRAVARPVASAV